MFSELIWALAAEHDRFTLEEEEKCDEGNVNEEDITGHSRPLKLSATHCAHNNASRKIAFVAFVIAINYNL